MAPACPLHRQSYPVRTHISCPTSPAIIVHCTVPKRYHGAPKAGEHNFAKAWIRTRISRARTIPEHLKTGEDLLLKWVDPDTDLTLAPSVETSSFTMQMFGLLKPDGGLGGVFAPSGALAAHPGTYLAAQSAVLGIIPVIGMSKGYYVEYREEVGEAGMGVRLQCKGCSICKGPKCKGFCTGGAHTVDSHHTNDEGERNIGHILVRQGDSKVLDSSIKNMHGTANLPTIMVSCIISDWGLLLI